MKKYNELTDTEKEIYSLTLSAAANAAMLAVISTTNAFADAVDIAAVAAIAKIKQAFLENENVSR